MIFKQKINNILPFLETAEEDINKQVKKTLNNIFLDLQQMIIDSEEDCDY
jgi:hypothetical protein